ncbi:MAG: hypothetical protein LBH05_07565 [Deferribacteraceae bacterium]|jgi:chemotaxis regulatin CheY-phosphate phosphatase CheZ|nr:hypothetical protein [Deferribacteraceae bacterium]
MSLDELKDISNKIISGESGKLEHAVKGEIAELLLLLIDIKKRVDEIPPNVLSSQQDIPRVVSSLTDVNQSTEKAAFNLLGSAKAMADFYKSLQRNVESMRKAIEAKDNDKFETHKNELASHIMEADDLGFHILEALEFQDITQQKINKVILTVEEIGARLGAMIGFMKPSLESNEEKKNYDKILSDFGFA